MTLDLLVKNGLVVDGSGGPAKKADIGVKDGKIVGVGDMAALGLVSDGARVIDATGAIVTPGFVDIHTHYDGQITWDQDLMPSSIHGVTTCVLGSCGVGFAPCKVEFRERLIELMEGVEDIPGTALSEGIKWRWESFDEYMAALEKDPRAIDYALAVPHDALRVYAMGERAIRGEDATDADVAAMRSELRRALEAGAAGFSTGRTDNHRSRSGAPTPGAEASARELSGIAEAFVGLKHGVLQAVSDFDMTTGPDRFDTEFDVLEKMAEAAPGHRMSVSLMQRDQEVNQWRRIIDRVEKASAKGLLFRTQVAPRGIGVLLGLEATFHPFMGFPSYKEIAHLSLAERVAALRDPVRRAKLLSEKSDKVAGDGSAIPPVADWLLAQINQIAFRIFRLGEHPDYEPPAQASLGAKAQMQGISSLEAILDALLENEGQELLYFPIYNYAGMNLDSVGEMLNHPLSLPGLSDGGAHVGTICDASFPTFLLSYWARDRKTGQIPLERAVQMLTSDTASHMGFSDRGRIQVGLRADLNIIDHAALSLKRPHLVADLPAGGRRLLQEAVGYRQTIVAGQVVVENGKLTGARPGRLVRAGQLASS